MQKAEQYQTISNTKHAYWLFFSFQYKARLKQF